MAEETWYRKEASAGHYHTLYGPLTLLRHTYQTGAGGQTFCPLEDDCQLRFGAATPLLAEILSFKLSALTSREVAQDLAKSHDLELSPGFLQQTMQRVGHIAVAKSECWQ